MKIEQRINYYEVAPEAIKIMMEMEKHIKMTSLDRKLQELIKVRISQINGCAFCINIHTSHARKIGETEQRLYCVSSYVECVFYSESEKVALEVAEHVTLISTMRVPDDLYERARQYYSEKDYVELIVLINQINSWNRISIAMGNIAK